MRLPREQPRVAHGAALDRTCAKKTYLTIEARGSSRSRCHPASRGMAPLLARVVASMAGQRRPRQVLESQPRCSIRAGSAVVSSAQSNERQTLAEVLAVFRVASYNAVQPFTLEPTLTPKALRVASRLVF